MKEVIIIRVVKTWSLLNLSNSFWREEIIIHDPRLEPTVWTGLPA